MQDQQNAPEKRQSMAIPVAIVIAGILVGSGIYLSGKDTTGTKDVMAPASEEQSGVDINLRPISSKDHIIGTRDADITFIEYSDFECPFCKTFHQSVQKLMDVYDDRVAWAFRHYPIAELHSKAPKEAQAAECAADQDKFWEYVDRIFAITPSNNRLADGELPRIASDLNMDVDAFNRCLSSTAHVADVNQSIKDAEAAGANGTPTSFLTLSSPLSAKAALDIQVMSASLKLPDGTLLVTISKDRKIVSLIGALPYDIVKGIMDIALSSI